MEKLIFSVMYAPTSALVDKFVHIKVQPLMWCGLPVFNLVSDRAIISELLSN